MRVISAHYAWNGESGFIKNPLLFLNDLHEVTDLVEQGTHYKEYAGTEFFSGLLVPAFLNVIEYDDQLSDSGIVKTMNLLHTNGSLFVAVDNRNYDQFITYQHPIPRFFKYTTDNQAEKIKSIASSEPVWQNIKNEIEKGENRIDFLLRKYLSLSFKAVGMDHIGGSFSKGQTPGVLLIEGINWAEMTFVSQIKLHILETP